MFNWYNLVEIMFISLHNKKLSHLKNVQDRLKKIFLTINIKKEYNRKIVK